MKPFLQRSLPREPPGGFLQTGWLWHKIYRNGTEKAVHSISGFWSASSKSRIYSTSLQRKSGGWMPNSGTPSGKPGRAWANATGNSASSGLVLKRTSGAGGGILSGNPGGRIWRRTGRRSSGRSPGRTFRGSRRSSCPGRGLQKCQEEAPQIPVSSQVFQSPAGTPGCRCLCRLCASIRISPSPQMISSITGGSWKSSIAGKQRQQPPQGPGSRRFSNATKTEWNSPPNLNVRIIITLICLLRVSPAPEHPGSRRADPHLPESIQDKQQKQGRQPESAPQDDPHWQQERITRAQRAAALQRNKRKNGSGHGMF